MQNNNRVFACGWTASGRLGVGHNLNQHICKPVQLKTLDSIPIQNIYAGSAQSYFVTTDGKVYVCGWGNSFRLGHGDGENIIVPTLMTGFGDYFIVEVSTPLCGLHGIARSRCGLVFTWGCSSLGRLGLENWKIGAYKTPTIVKSLADKNAKFVKAGTTHSFVGTVDNRMFGFGTTSALGLGGDVDTMYHCTFLPTEITALRGIPIKKIETVSHTLALTQNGQVYAWGSNHDFKCGIETSEKWIWAPTKILKDYHVVDIAVGHRFSIFCTKNGVVYGFGQGYGIPGYNQTTVVPVKCTSLLKYRIVSVYAGFSSSVLRSSDGKVWACGKNIDGQLGVGELNYHYVNPMFISSFSDIQIKSVACGWDHTIFLEGRPNDECIPLIKMIERFADVLLIFADE